VAALFCLFHTGPLALLPCCDTEPALTRDGVDASDRLSGIPASEPGGKANFFVCVWYWGVNSAYTLSHSTSPFVTIDFFFKLGSCKLFTRAGFKLRSS
jgi:hypothetical protein